MRIHALAAFVHPVRQDAELRKENQLQMISFPHLSLPM